MEIEGDGKISTETEIPNGLEKAPYELNLLNNLQRVQTKTEEGNDQKQTNELESQVDLQKLPDEAHTQDNKAVATTDDELICDHAIFGDVLTKMKAFANKSKPEKFEKSIFIVEREIFNDFFNLIEKHEKNLTDEDLLVVKKGFRLFIHATDNINPNILFTTDLVDDKKEIFYMYFNLINLDTIQNYLKNAQMPDNLKILYRICISRILIVINGACIYTDLTSNDLKRPINFIELLSLMLNYAKTDLKSSNLTLRPSNIDASITRDLILYVIWNYSDHTIMVPDLIEAGCLETIIDGLTMICK
jgi:hypothetical protein